jgi:hypothetical protein
MTQLSQGFIVGDHEQLQAKRAEQRAETSAAKTAQRMRRKQLVCVPLGQARKLARGFQSGIELEDAGFQRVD